MNKRKQRQFDAADRAALNAAAEIECTIENLLEQIDALEDVAWHYAIETLVEALIERNPKALDHLNGLPGDASMRLANALMDWRDQRGER
jgi:hypothetical protein